MNKIEEKIFRIVSIVIIFFLGINIIYSINFQTEGKESDANIFSDNLVLSNTTTNVGIISYDQDSTDYTNGKRFKIIQNNNTEDGEGFLHSEQYGDFYVKIGEKIDIEKKSSGTNCSGGVEYSFTGKLVSTYWGELPVTNKSYYCPETEKYKMYLKSEVIGEISFSGSTQNTFNVTNSRGQEITVTEADLFKNQNLAIDGNISSDDISSTIDDELGLQKSKKLEFEGDMLNVRSIIKKNLEKYTVGRSPKTDTSLDGFGSYDPKGKIHFYNYELTEGNYEHSGNKGKILKLDDAGELYTVRGKQLLYVKGGNVYIKGDIKNNSNFSQLVIVATRDSTNNKNGGNIYIDPSVTNIDAVLIADGSILSYNGIKVISSINSSEQDLLRRQLLIYGSISTKNTLGEDKAKYGTDHYIENNGEEVDTGLYNLGNLRNFQVVSSNGIESGTCTNPNEITARNNTGTGSLTYAFAGKKECYINESVTNGLRGTEKTSGVVIEYNPTLQTSPHFILRK